MFSNSNIKYNINDKSLKNIANIYNIFYPKNVKEVQQLVRYAKKFQLGVRVLDSEHSPRNAIFSKDTTCLYLNLDGEFRKIHSIDENSHHDHAIVSVGSGCNLGVNPKDKRSTRDN